MTRSQEIKIYPKKKETIGNRENETSSKNMEIAKPKYSQVMEVPAQENATNQPLSTHCLRKVRYPATYHQIS